MALDDSDLMNVVRSAGAEELYIVFSHIGYPRGKFAQSNLLSRATVDRIFVNTLDNDWYQRDVDRIEAGLADAISSLGPRRVTCAGSSMGAYAALLFGSRNGADRVIAVAPEITIGEPWQRSVSLNTARLFDPRFANLHDTITAGNSAEIYVAGYDMIDLASFDERLINHEGTKVTTVSGGHNFALRLNWSRLYAGDNDVGIPRIAERPRKMHEYTNSIRALHEGKTDDAVTILLSRCEWSDFAPDFYFAALHMTARDISKATALLQHALELDPHGEQSHHHLGLCLKAQGHLDEAAAQFRAALAINGAAHATNFRLAETLSALGHKEGAAIHLKKALDIDPNNKNYRALANQLLITSSVSQKTLASTFANRSKAMDTSECSTTTPTATIWVQTMFDFNRVGGVVDIADDYGQTVLRLPPGYKFSPTFPDEINQYIGK